MMILRAGSRFFLTVLIGAAVSVSVEAQPAVEIDRRLLDPQLDSTQRDSLVLEMLRTSKFDQLALVFEQAPRLLAAVVVAQIGELDASERQSQAFRLLARVVAFDPVAWHEEALAILAEHRDRDAIRVCMGMLNLEEMRSSTQIVTRVIAVLVQQTGQTALGTDIDSWERWWSQVEWLPEVQWLQQLVEAHAARAVRAQQLHTTQLSEMVDLYRRVYAQTSDAQRETIVAEMLAHEHNPLRFAGLDLIERGVVNGRLPSQPVQQLLAGMLLDADISVRTRAAIVSARSLTESPGQVLIEALVTEHSEEAARELLVLAARWPSASGTQTLWQWIEQPSTRALAIEALTAAAHQGALDLPQMHRRAVSVLDAVRWADASIQEVRLLGALDVRASIVQMLEHLHTMPGVTRLEAIRVVLRLGGYTSELARACARDGTLLVRVRDELKAMRPDSHGLGVLMQCFQAAQPTGPGAGSMELVLGFLRGIPPDEQRLMVQAVLGTDIVLASWEQALTQRLGLVQKASATESKIGLNPGDDGNFP